MDLALRLVFMSALLAAGIAAREVGILGETRRKRLNAVAFYGVLPALIFTSTFDQPLSDLISAELVVGLWIVLFSLLGVAWVVHRRTTPRGTRSVAMVQSYHGNLGFLGLPLVALTLGSAAAGQASVILGVAVLTQVPLTILILISVNDAEASLAQELRSVVTNPVIIALVIGIGVSALSAQIPAVVVTGLDGVAELALPVALVLVGSSLELELPSSEWQVLGSVVGLKVFLMPVLAWTAFTALGADPLTRNAGVVMFGAPTAVSTFIYATELGGDAEFASIGIFTTTIVSIGTLGLVLQLVV